MGTRSIIVITGPSRTDSKGPCDFRSIRLYKHWDGYPSANLPLVAAAIGCALKLLSDENARFKDTRGFIAPLSLAGCLIGASTTATNIGCRMEEEQQDPFDVSILGDQSDLEWVYVIDTEERTVRVYGGGFYDCSPQDHYKRGMVKDIFSDGRDEQITRALVTIESFGFKVNPKPAVSNVVRLPTVGQLLASMVKEPTAPKAKARKGSRLQPWQLKGGK